MACVGRVNVGLPRRLRHPRKAELEVGEDPSGQVRHRLQEGGAVGEDVALLADQAQAHVPLPAGTAEAGDAQRADGLRSGSWIVDRQALGGQADARRRRDGSRVRRHPLGRAQTDRG